MTESCDSCPLIARREFLRTATGMATTALVALGASPSWAAAAPVSFIDALRGGREDKTYPIPAADGTQIDKANDAIITRWQGKVYVFSLACPHQNTALKWSDKKLQFECPKHHSQFTPDGTYVRNSGRATRGLDRFAVRKEGETVVVNLDKLYEQDKDTAAWDAAFITA